MNNFTFIKTKIDGVIIVETKTIGDNRGYFMETYEQRKFAEGGITADFVQDNQSKSVKGVLRGLHLQKKHPQAKLVRVIKGTVYDVAVDLREGSPTYSEYVGIILSEENKKQFFIPRGFAHGFLVLSDEAEFVYKCDDFYYPGDELGIAWNDPSIDVRWPDLVGEYRGSASAEGYFLKDGTKIILSEKDEKLKTLNEI